MPKEFGSEVLRIARDIEQYLDKHQEAADTLEGIVKWWLLRQRLEEAPGKVQQALNYLCEAGVVRELTVQGGEKVYVSGRAGLRADTEELTEQKKH